MKKKVDFIEMTKEVKAGRWFLMLCFIRKKNEGSQSRVFM